MKEREVLHVWGGREIRVYQKKRMRNRWRVRRREGDSTKENKEGESQARGREIRLRGGRKEMGEGRLRATGRLD